MNLIIVESPIPAQDSLLSRSASSHREVVSVGRAKAKVL